MKVLLLTILLTKAAPCTGTQSLRPYYIRAAVEHEFNGSAVNFTRSGNQTSRTDGSHTREASVDKAGVLSIPVYLDEKAGWYGRFRVGKVPARSKDESKEWMLEIATAESATSYNWWTLEVLYISIGPPRSKPWQGQLYPTLDIRLKSHQLGRDANYSRPELANNEEINGKMILDSNSPWTRLHPLLVDYYYSQISTAKSFNNTFYVPCDLEEGGIPEIGVTVWQQEGKLCGGSIQYINATIFRKFNRNVDQVFGLIGRSFFQSYYIVFKTIDVSSKAPQRMVGIAGGRVI
ncbi:hypothetical protein TWF594_001666 [Orbilia oligospora]|nr:hypothetical protein TWF594_001666 [Orbilia oligospora]